MAKGFKISKKGLLIGFVVLVVIGAAMMYGVKEGFEDGEIGKALSGAGDIAKKVVGNTVGLAATGVEGVARVTDVAASAVADTARNLSKSARNLANGSGNMSDSNE